MHVLKTTQFIPISIEEAWDFFSDPTNLGRITPSKMNFKILNKSPGDKMFEGMIITYKVSPMLGMPINWMTEITHVRDKEYFVDEQRIGPYKIWHHEHHFRQTDKGVEMTDVINYVLPIWNTWQTLEQNIRAQ